MARKKESNEPKLPVPFYKVVNLTESAVQVPYYNPNGELEYLHLRLQGKGGQKPPVIPAAAITERALDLVKKKIIRLDNAN